MKIKNFKKFKSSWFKLLETIFVQLLYSQSRPLSYAAPSHQHERVTQ